MTTVARITPERVLKAFRKLNMYTTHNSFLWITHSSADSPVDHHIDRFKFGCCGLTACILSDNNLSEKEICSLFLKDVGEGKFPGFDTIGGSEDRGASLDSWYTQAILSKFDNELFNDKTGPKDAEKYLKNYKFDNPKYNYLLGFMRGWDFCATSDKSLCRKAFKDDVFCMGFADGQNCHAFVLNEL